MADKTRFYLDTEDEPEELAKELVARGIAFAFEVYEGRHAFTVGGGQRDSVTTILRGIKETRPIAGRVGH